MKMSRALLGALMLLVVSQPAAAKVQTFPASFQTKTVQTDGAIIYVRVGRSRACSRVAAWLRRYWRNVGPLGGGACAGSYSHSPRLTRHGPLVSPRRWIR